MPHNSYYYMTYTPTHVHTYTHVHVCSYTHVQRKHIPNMLVWAYVCTVDCGWHTYTGSISKVHLHAQLPSLEKSNTVESVRP